MARGKSATGAQSGNAKVKRTRNNATTGGQGRRLPKAAYELFNEYFFNLGKSPDANTRIALAETVKQMPGGELCTPQKVSRYFSRMRSKERTGVIRTPEQTQLNATSQPLPTALAADDDPAVESEDEESIAGQEQGQQPDDQPQQVDERTNIEQRQSSPYEIHTPEGCYPSEEADLTDAEVSLLAEIGMNPIYAYDHDVEMLAAASDCIWGYDPTPPETIAPTVTDPDPAESPGPVQAPVQEQDIAGSSSVDHGSQSDLLASLRTATSELEGSFSYSHEAGDAGNSIPTTYAELGTWLEECNALLAEIEGGAYVQLALGEALPSQHSTST